MLMVNTLDTFLRKIKGTFNTTGISMLPLIGPKDKLSFNAIQFSKIKINDLLLFRKNNELIVHRVIYKTKRFLITKGDNNLKSDGKVYSRQVLGRVKKIKRSGQVLVPETMYLLQSGHYLQEINRLNRAFTKANLNFVFLKGLPLYLYYQKSHPQRFYADCDVLIKSKELGKAKKILQRYGYTQAKKTLVPFLTKISKYEPELVFYKTINGFTVTFDLHQELVFQMTELGRLNWLYPQSQLTRFTNEALATKRLVSLNNQKYPILSPEFLIIYLGLHLFHHNYRGAFRYQFWQQVLHKEATRPSFSWTKTAKLMQAYQLKNYLTPAFVLLKKYYPIKLPIWLTKGNKTPKVDIFSEKGRINSGLTRFWLLFYFSPRPFWLRFLTFLDPVVIITGFWVIKQYLFRFQARK